MHKTIENLEIKLNGANANLEYLLKKLYGRKTEKTSVIDDQLIIGEISLGLFNEAEANQNPKVLESIPFGEPKKKTRAGYKRKEIFKNLPQEDRVYSLEESERDCPSIFNPYISEPVLQHSYAIASSVAWTMHQKFV